jgi:hypothetical protein
MIDIEKLRGHLGNLWAQTSMSDIGSKSKLDEALTELERLQKREVAMKPFKSATYICPACSKKIYPMYQYCIHCCQKLDWSDEK